MIKITYLCSALLLSFIPAFGMETSEDSWVFTGNFKHTFSAAHLNRQFRAAPKEKNFIENINCYGYQDGMTRIIIDLVHKHLSEFYHAYPDFQQRLKNVGKQHEQLSNLFQSYPNQESAFLELFYNCNLIPNYTIDRILKEMNLEDFRLNGERFLEIIEQKRGEDLSADHFHNLVVEELENIKDPRRQSEILWHVIGEISQQSPVNRKLMLELCNRIQDPSLPFYGQVQILIADLNMSDDNVDLRSVDRYRSAIIPLLKAGNAAESKELLNRFVAAFYNNDSVEQTSLPEEVQNLDLTAEKIFELLKLNRDYNNNNLQLGKDLERLEDIVSHQKSYIEQLEEKIKQLKDEKKES